MSRKLKKYARPLAVAGGVMFSNQLRSRAEAPALPGESDFELYFRIEPIVVLSGPNPGRWSVFESVRSNRILDHIKDCAQRGVPIYGLICERGALTRRSIRTLNCFLRHSPDLRLFYRQSRYSGGHRFAWQEFQRFLGLVWER